jgi:SAM-dependent methyltransferase
MHEPADRIIDHYERHARAWDADRRMAKWNDKPWHDRFIAPLPSAASILDLGCGSGSPVAKYMVEHGLHVTGVDTSPTLISLCRQRLPGQEWLVKDMRSLQLSRRFDGVLAWDSFFLPTAVETPSWETGYTTTPSPHHPIGAKGVGESPNVGGVSAFSNAVNDAFAHLGLTHTVMPHDHWRVWKTAQSLGLAAG